MVINSSISCKYSFIVPAFNVADYLEECVGSILSQTFRDFELIIVDDGSKDTTGAIADKIAKCDNRVRVIHQSNGGLSVARNTGLNEAIGKWIVFIDGDDFWRNTTDLETINREVDLTPECDFIGFNASYFYPSTGKYDDWVEYSPVIQIPQCGQDCINYLIKSGTFPMSACFKVLNREFLIENKLTFMPGTYCEDIPWFVRMMKLARSVRFLNHYVYAYRKEVVGSISASVSDKKYSDLKSIVLSGIYETDKSDESLLSFWAYELCILLGMISFFPPEKRKAEYLELSKFTDIFNFTINPKVKLVHTLKKFLGMKLTTKLLGVFMHRKLS